MEQGMWVRAWHWWDLETATAAPLARMMQPRKKAPSGTLHSPGRSALLLRALPAETAVAPIPIGP